MLVRGDERRLTSREASKTKPGTLIGCPESGDERHIKHWENEAPNRSKVGNFSTFLQYFEKFKIESVSIWKLIWIFPCFVAENFPLHSGENVLIFF